MANKPNIYRTMMEELQSIISDLQSEDIDVDDALDKYVRGQKLLVDLTMYLKGAVNKIEHIKPDITITTD